MLKVGAYGALTLPNCQGRKPPTLLNWSTSVTSETGYCTPDMCTHRTTCRVSVVLFSGKDVTKANVWCRTHSVKVENPHGRRLPSAKDRRPRQAEEQTLGKTLSYLRFRCDRHPPQSPEDLLDSVYRSTHDASGESTVDLSLRTVGHRHSGTRPTLTVEERGRRRLSHWLATRTGSLRTSWCSCPYTLSRGKGY